MIDPTARTSGMWDITCNLSTFSSFPFARARESIRQACDSSSTKRFYGVNLLIAIS